MNPIGYVDRTWNPMTGCSPVSEGCRNCWARRMAKRLAANPSVKHRKRYANFMPTFWKERLDEPDHWRKPQVVAVNFMGDMFHPDHPWSCTAQVFNAMRRYSQHTFLILTKRPRLAWGFLDCYWRAPAENIWIGVSAENQAAWDERVPDLLACRAAHRWVSMEPLLELVLPAPRGSGTVKGLDWIVVGRETGPGARPFQHHWKVPWRIQTAMNNISLWEKGEGRAGFQEKPF